MDEGGRGKVREETSLLDYQVSAFIDSFEHAQVRTVKIPIDIPAR